MTVKIVRPIRGGTVRAPASKSEAQRLLICAALADEKTYVGCPERSEDIDAAVRCLIEIGAEIKHDGRGFSVSPIDIKNIDRDRRRVLDCGESGAVLRFLFPVCGALGVNANFLMRGNLPERPVSALCDAMAANGCDIRTSDRTTISCGGQLKNGVYFIPGNISSQFVSGLLFALPLLPGESTIEIARGLGSRPYADMTIAALKSFNINIKEEKNKFVCRGQGYVSPGKINAGGDWTNAAAWLAMGFVGVKNVSCAGLDVNSTQGDRAIMELLRNFGARITVNGDVASIAENEICSANDFDENALKNTSFNEKLKMIGKNALVNKINENIIKHDVSDFVIDARDIPDLVPILAAAASALNKKTIIKNAARLRLKESDRLLSVSAALNSLGANITETDDGLIIKDRNKMPGGVADSFNDHRIVTAAAVLSAACDGPVTIRGAEAVNKSYPGFFNDFIRLGGEIDMNNTVDKNVENMKKRKINTRAD